MKKNNRNVDGNRPADMELNRSEEALLLEENLEFVKLLQQVEGISWLNDSLENVQDKIKQFNESVIIDKCKIPMFSQHTGKKLMQADFLSKMQDKEFEKLQKVKGIYWFSDPPEEIEKKIVGFNVTKEQHSRIPLFHGKERLITTDYICKIQKKIKEKVEADVQMLKDMGCDPGTSFLSSSSSPYGGAESSTANNKNPAHSDGTEITTSGLAAKLGKKFPRKK